jgi:hypothetical protein
MNVFAGFFISWGVWMWVVAPLYGFDASYGRGLEITCIFTVSSLIRSYVVRRFFNNGWHMAAVRLAAKIKEWLT